MLLKIPEEGSKPDSSILGTKVKKQKGYQLQANITGQSG